MLLGVAAAAALVVIAQRVSLRKELLQLSNACGAKHPLEVPVDAFETIDPGFTARSAREVFGYS
jgi:hypothetical protein